MGNRTSISMKLFTVLQTSAIVLAVVFVFATDVAADPDDGLPIEELATEEFPKVEGIATDEFLNGEVNQRTGQSANGASAALVADQLQTNVQDEFARYYRRRRTHVPHRHSVSSKAECGKYCVDIYLYNFKTGGKNVQFCCTCEDGPQGFETRFNQMKNQVVSAHANSGCRGHLCSAAGSHHSIRRSNDQQLRLAHSCIKQKCERNGCWRAHGYGEILAEKSSTASHQDSLDPKDLLADVAADDTDKEDTDSLTDVQARDGFCRWSGGWRR